MDRFMSVPHSVAPRRPASPQVPGELGETALVLGMLRRVGPETDGPTGAEAPPGELQAGDAMLHGCCTALLLPSTALGPPTTLWGASRPVVPREHGLPQMVSVGHVKAQPLVWQ